MSLPQSMLDPDWCQATVYRRDTYRRTGRGKTGFEMHYTEGQCSRKRPRLFHFCWQHAHPVVLEQSKKEEL